MTEVLTKNNQEIDLEDLSVRYNERVGICLFDGRETIIKAKELAREQVVEEYRELGYTNANIVYALYKAKEVGYI